MKQVIAGRVPPSWGLRMQSVLRIVAGFLFIWPGTTKLFAFPAGRPPDNATAAFGSQIWFGGLLEVVGGTLMLLGLFTRPVAFILAGEMAVAYWQFHAPRSLWPTINGGNAAALFSFVWLYYFAAGAGPWSLDALLGSRRRHVPEHQDAPQFRTASNE